MFPAAINAIERMKPKAFIFENVKGLLRQTFADYFDYILLRLTYPSFNAEVTSDWQQHLDALRSANNLSYLGTKYNVQFKLINAANYCVPQNRDRVIIVGIRSDLDREWVFPAETHSADRLFWDMYVNREYWERHKISKSERPVIDRSIGAVRYLTVLETKRLQTFPDDFAVKGVWGEAMRQIGNAVPVLLAQIMGRELMTILNSCTYCVTADRIFEEASLPESRQLILSNIKY